MRPFTRLSWCLVAFAAAGCAPDLRTDFPFDGALPDGVYFKTEALPSGLNRSVVTATSKNSYVYVDLDTAKDLPAHEALETNAWDLAFQRYKIPLNGGAGGPGPVEAAVLVNQNFDALTRAPATGFIQDASDPVLNGPEGGWYYYDLGKHKLYARQENFYVVHTTAGAYFKLRFLAYYDAAGTAGMVSFEWKAVDAP
ncbi:MAG: HmuY family protein [Myxococcaceae bacterium]|nr:HmuY family protein [Myxococcaceae bacterium]